MDRPTRYPGVRATPAGKIEINYKVRGRHYWETLDLSPTARNLAAAAKIREEHKARAKAGLAPIADPEVAYVGEVAQSYLDSIRLRLKPSTVQSYKEILNIYWLPALGPLPIREIRFAPLREIDDGFNWPSPKTRKNALVPLYGLFRHALSGDLIDANPVEKFPYVKLERKQPQAYTREQRAELLKCEEGVDPVLLADTTGHSVETMLKVYREVRKRADHSDHLNKIGDL